MSNNVYKPDKWSIIKIESNDPHYRVVGSWYGGYGGSDSWKLSSGILSCKINENYYDIPQHSGSLYVCHKETYGMSFYTSGVVAHYIDQASKLGSGIKITLLDEDEAIDYLQGIME